MGPLKLMIEAEWWERYVAGDKNFKVGHNVNLAWMPYMQHIKKLATIISLPPNRGFVDPPKTQIERHAHVNVPNMMGFLKTAHQYLAEEEVDEDEKVNKILMLSARKSTQFDNEIKLFHGGIEGHWGVTATIKRLQEKGIQWKNMAQDVRSFVKSCSVCQKLTDKSSKSHGSSFTVSVEEPNQRIIEPNQRNLINAYSAYSILMVIESTRGFHNPFQSSKLPNGVELL